MITSSEATFRALLSSSIADAGERERLAAQLARASEAEVARQKTQLAATLRQEISAPLNSIIATAEQLRRSGLDHPQREHAESLAAAARALLCVRIGGRVYPRRPPGRWRGHEEKVHRSDDRTLTLPRS